MMNKEKSILLLLIISIVFICTVSNVNIINAKIGEYKYSNWAQNEVIYANDFGIIPDGVIDMTASITKENLTKSMLYFYLTYEKEIPEVNIMYKDTKDIDIINASALGLISGKDQYFYPENNIKREDAFILVNNLLDKLHVNIPVIEDIVEFKDNELISNESFNSIQRLYKLGLIEGIGDNKINPKDDISMEELFALLVRVNKLIKESDIVQLKKHI